MSYSTVMSRDRPGPRFTVTMSE